MRLVRAFQWSPRWKSFGFSFRFIRFSWNSWISRIEVLSFGVCWLIMIVSIWFSRSSASGDQINTSHFMNLNATEIRLKISLFDQQIWSFHRWWIVFFSIRHKIWTHTGFVTTFYIVIGQLSNNHQHLLHHHHQNQQNQSKCFDLSDQA